MASTLLHLVDDEGQPVGPAERIAVEGAYCYAAREFPRIDNAVLTGMAEAVAVAMSRRLEEIRSVNQWALAAVFDWGVGRRNFHSHKGAKRRGCLRALRQIGKTGFERESGGGGPERTLGAAKDYASR